MENRLGAIVGFVALVALGCASTADAATVQIGSALSPTPSMTTATPGSYTLITPKTQISQPTTSPVDGTVVSWQTVGWFGSNFRVRVVDPLGGGDFRGAGTGPAFNITSTGPTGPISVNLPIKQGQLIGVNAAGSFGYSYRPAAGASFYVTPPLSDGATSTGAANGTNEYVYNATVRYCQVPDLRGMKLKDARSALAAADCAAGTVSPGKRKRKGKFVRSQSVAVGASISDTAPIDLRVGKKPKHA